MRNIKIIIEYDGKKFGGWQKQPTKLNIQGEIEKAIKELTGEEVSLTASGRTDAGVHALGQVANFKTNSNIEIVKFAIAINSKLKKSIVIKSAEEVEERFHSKYCVKSKTYRYIINNYENGIEIVIRRLRDGTLPASKGGLIGTMRGISEYDSLASIKALYDAASDVDLFYSRECQEW